MSSTPQRITKFTNGRLLRNGQLVEGDLWVNSSTGLIMSSQSAFYSAHMTPDHIVDLERKILSPGFIDVQLNGWHGLDFSVPSEQFQSKLQLANGELIKTGVTSYVPTITSQQPEVYQANLPFLGPNTSRDTTTSESLGAHVEGPFISPARNGIHAQTALITASSFADLESCYGATHLNDGTIRKITAAPELGNMTQLIPELTSRGIIYSIGHSDANFEQAQAALAAGATMVTHMFNAMRPFGHRDPGIFGLLGSSRPPTPTASPKTSTPSTPTTTKPAFQPVSNSNSPRNSRRSTPRSSLSISSTPFTSNSAPSHLPDGKPYFGLIADLIHLSAPTLVIAHHAAPHNSILVTDAMPLAGLPNGVYPSSTTGDRIVKTGTELRLESNGRIAGAAVPLIDCVNNFKKALGDSASWGEVLGGVTARPAAMLGVENKGNLDVRSDADLVVLSEVPAGEDSTKLVVEQVWKFGVQVV